MLGLVAITVAGFPSSVESSALWLSLTRRLCARLQHRFPYLFAVCCFLREQLGDRAHVAAEFTGHDLGPGPAVPPAAGSYSAILCNQDLDLSDRIGFACRFLDDAEVRGGGDMSGYQVMTRVCGGG